MGLAPQRLHPFGLRFAPAREEHPPLWLFAVPGLFRGNPEQIRGDNPSFQVQILKLSGGEPCWRRWAQSLLRCSCSGCWFSVCGWRSMFFRAATSSTGASIATANEPFFPPGITRPWLHSFPPCINAKPLPVAAMATGRPLTNTHFCASVLVAIRAVRLRPGGPLPPFHSRGISFSPGGYHQMEERNFRPQSLNDFIGQTKIKQTLGLMLNSARIQGQPLEHIILFGGAGLGKTCSWLYILFVNM